MSHCGPNTDKLPSFGKLAVWLYFLVVRPSVALPFLNLNIRQTLTAKTRPLLLGFAHLSVADSIVPCTHTSIMCAERMVSETLQDIYDTLKTESHSIK